MFYCLNCYTFSIIYLIQLSGAMDPKGKRNTFEDVMRANLALFDYILLDENIQVNGLVFVIDLTGFTRHHFVSSGVDNTRKCMQVTQASSVL